VELRLEEDKEEDTKTCPTFPPPADGWPDGTGGCPD
jgi:hypothetical protein